MESDNYMNRNIGQEATSPGHYKPSGKVNLLRFVPLLVVGVVVAVGMAFVLLMLEADFYYFIFVPVLVSMPVVGMLFLLIRFGHCRNRAVAIIAGLLLMMIFYIGYWQMSYLNVVYYYGPDEAPLIREGIRMEGKAPGLLGYINFRCKSNTISSTPADDPDREPSAIDAVGNYYFYGLEFLIMIAFATVTPFLWSSRLYYEDCRRWSALKKFRYDPGHIGGIIDCIESEDWRKLGTLPRLPAMGNTQKTYTELRIEYLKKMAGQPLYLTVAGANLGALAANLPGKKRFGGIFARPVNKKYVSPDQALVLAHYFPELEIPGSENVELPPAPEEENLPEGVTVEEQPVAQVKYAAGFKGLLQKAGLMQAVIEGPDFREKAVEASKTVVARSGSFNKPADLGQSLCLAADGDQSKLLKQASSMGLKILGLVLTGLIVSVIFIGFGLDNYEADGSRIYLIGAIFGGVLLAASVILLFIKDVIISAYLKGRLMNRRDGILNIPPNTKHIILRIEDQATFHINKSIPEDIGLCFLDVRNQRLLFEGITHRYIIRGEDVISISPIISAEGSSAVGLSYSVGETRLSLVFARIDIMARISIVSLLSGGGPSGALCKKLCKALGISLK